MLEEIGKLITESFRGEDFSARYGGEEFIVILYDTNYEQTVNIAEKFRTKLESNSFSNLNITISIGALTVKVTKNTDIS